MKWLNEQKNGTGKDAPTWKGDTRIQTGNYTTKRKLLANLKKQQGLPDAYSFVTGTVPGK